MKILLLSFGVWEYDGRLRELVKISSKIGETISLVRTKEDLSEKNIVAFKSSRSYLRWILFSIRQVLKMKPDILFVDNRAASIVYYILRMFYRPKILIYDARELHLLKEATSLRGRIACRIEMKIIRKSDVIIAANNERSIFMKDLYNLDVAPLVYENVRELDSIDSSSYFEKYKYITDLNKKIVISTSGCSYERGLAPLIDNFYKLNDYLLIIVGKCKNNEINTIQPSNNILLIGQVPFDELSYLISISDIGIVNYHQNNTNNILCASGKLYEFVFQGLPIVTTSNPPLKNICKRYNIGLVDDTFINAIKEVGSKYNYFSNNVQVMATHLKGIDFNSICANQIMEEIF